VSAVFTSGDPLLLGNRAGEDVYTKAIGDASFMPTWSAVQADGLFNKVDWIVKVSPDTVFLPERLRLHLKEHTTGKKNFAFEKCDKFQPTPLYGVFDVRNRGAIQQFFWNMDSCKDKLGRSIPNEDEFVQKCLNTLSIETYYDSNLFYDSVCGQEVNCWDKSKAAYHNFPDFQGYLDCWKHAMQ